MSLTTEQISTFLKISSFHGLESLYILKLSFEKPQAFNRKVLFEEMFPGPGGGDYCYGFIVACTAFGLCSYNLKDDVLTMTYFDAVLSNLLKEELVNRASGMQDRIDHIAKIENHFK